MFDSVTPWDEYYIMNPVPRSSFRLPSLPNIIGGAPSVPRKILGAVVVAGTVAAGAYAVRLGWHRLKRMAGFYPPVKMAPSPAAVTNHGRESKWAGSAEIAMPLAKGQVIMGHYDGDTLAVSGCGFRMDMGDGEYIVVPCHVWDEVSARNGGTVVMRGPSGDVSIQEKDMEMVEVLTDVYVARMPKNAFARMGVTKTKIGRVENKAVAKVAGPHGKGTIGNISLAQNHAAMGTLWYEATTLPGYSGSPYTVEGNVVGIHLRGAETQGGPNIGLSAKMVYVTSKYLFKIKNEDSEEWLVEMCKKRKVRMRIDQNWGHSDSLRIQIGSDFAIIDRDVIAQALGEDWSEYSEYMDYEPKSLKNQESASGNEKTPGVSELSENSQGLQDQKPQSSTQVDLNKLKELLQKAEETTGKERGRRIRAMLSLLESSA